VAAMTPAAIGRRAAPDDRVEPGARVLTIPLVVTTMRGEKDLLALIFEIGLVHPELPQVAPYEREARREELPDGHPRGRWFASVPHGDTKKRGVHVGSYARRSGIPLWAQVDLSRLPKLVPKPERETRLDRSDPMDVVEWAAAADLELTAKEDRRDLGQDLREEALTELGAGEHAESGEDDGAVVALDGAKASR